MDAPLTYAEREEYYRDSLTANRLFGIPDRITPSNYREFEEYMRRMLQSDAIVVTDQAREIASALFSDLLGEVFRVGSTSGIGFLPDRLRKEFGFRWSARRDRWLRRTAWLSRHLRGHLPTLLCTNPIATLAQVRWALAGHSF